MRYRMVQDFRYRGYNYALVLRENYWCVDSVVSRQLVKVVRKLRLREVFGASLLPGMSMSQGRKAAWKRLSQDGLATAVSLQKV